MPPLRHENEIAARPIDPSLLPSISTNGIWACPFCLSVRLPIHSMGRVTICGRFIHVAEGPIGQIDGRKGRSIDGAWNILDRRLASRSRYSFSLHRFGPIVQRCLQCHHYYHSTYRRQSVRSFILAAGRPGELAKDAAARRRMAKEGKKKGRTDERTRGEKKGYVTTMT